MTNLLACIISGKEMPIVGDVIYATFLELIFAHRRNNRITRAIYYYKTRSEGGEKEELAKKYQE